MRLGKMRVVSHQNQWRKLSPNAQLEAGTGRALRRGSAAARSPARHGGCTHCARRRPQRRRASAVTRAGVPSHHHAPSSEERDRRALRGRGASPAQVPAVRRWERPSGRVSRGGSGRGSSGTDCSASRARKSTVTRRPPSALAAEDSQRQAEVGEGGHFLHSLGARERQNRISEPPSPHVPIPFSFSL